MPSHSATAAGAAPGESLGWLLLIPLGCLALGQAILAATGILPVLDGALGDPDAYMRLSRVLELHDSGSWFDSRFPRINPPDGHVQHWTRPLDALLLAGAWLLQPFLGFERALYAWGVLISPALLALAVLAVAWAAAPALDRDTRLFACLALLTQPAVLAYTGIGRPDHHSLLLLLALILIGLTARLAAAPQDRRLAGLAGAIAGLAIWVSCEAMTFVAVSLVTLGLFWLAGAPGMARASRAYVLTTALILAGALLIERGPDGLLAVETDRLSAAHVVLFTLIAAFWSAVGWAEAGAGARRSETALRAAAGSHGALIGRTLAALVGGAVVAGTMLALFPELRQGPLGQVDPLYARLRLQNIVEIQPLMPARWLLSGRIAEAVRRVVEFLGIGLFALPCLGLLLVRRSGPARRFWATVALALLVFVPLAFHQVRWTSYAEAFLVWPYAAGVAWLLGRLSGALERSGVLLRPLIILAALSVRGRRRPAPAGDPERRPRLPGPAPGGGAQSRRAGAGHPARLRRLRLRAALPDAASRAVDPQPSAAAGLRRDLAHPDRDRRPGRPGRAGALRRRLGALVPEPDRAGAVCPRGRGRAHALPAPRRRRAPGLAARRAARGGGRGRGAPVRGRRRRAAARAGGRRHGPVRRPGAASMGEAPGEASMVRRAW
jgi:hypothetical protein